MIKSAQTLVNNMRYVLIYDGAETASFNSSYAARIYAQGLVLNGWFSQPDKVRLWDNEQGCYILIEHLLNKAA